MALKRISTAVKSREDNPFVGPLTKRDIIVAAGAQWPTGSGYEYVIPLGVPLAPYTSGNGKYMPIRRSQLATALASSDTQIYVDNADGFATNDIIALFTGSPSTTNSLTATITAVDYANNILTVAALASNATVGITDAYVEVEHNGYLHNHADAVFLGENIQTKDALSGTTFDVPAVGFIAGQVDVTLLAGNCYDSLLETQIPGFDYIPETPGV
jgi:hypothetical protein